MTVGTDLNAGTRDSLLSGYVQAAAARPVGWLAPPPAEAAADSAELTAGRFVAGLARADFGAALLTATLADCERALVPGDPLTVAVRDSRAALSEA